MLTEKEAANHNDNHAPFLAYIELMDNIFQSNYKSKKIISALSACCL
jgi:hypothetical protein